MKAKHLEDRADRSSGKEDLRKEWLQLIQRARRVYFFQKWIDQRKERDISFGEITRWFYEDLRYLVQWNINIFLQLRAYGAIIKQVYGLSYIEQWYRMVYLVTVIRTNAKQLRKNHLFEENRWNRVKEFSFSRHFKVHNDVLGYPHHKEIEIIADKFKFFEYCRSKQLKTPEALAIFKRGKITFPSDGSFELPKSDLFVKELDTGQGTGAKKFLYKDHLYHDKDDKLFSEEDLHDFLTEYSQSTNNLIVQNVLKNHDSWKKFTNGNLASCRFITGISPDDESTIIPLFASLRMPFGNSDVDNYSRGGLAASIDLNSGRLSAAVTGNPMYGSFSYDIHPDSGHPIKGEVLPHWNGLIEFVKEYHRHFQTLSIGWDVSLTKNGFTMLEGNVEWGSDVIEAPSNQLIADSVYPKWFYGWAKQMQGKEVIPYALPWSK